MKPRFGHDCVDCVFLGSYEKHDLSYCEKTSILPTVIARYGEGGDYVSGMILATVKGIRYLYEAKRRAIKRGLMNNEKGFEHPHKEEA